MTLAVACRSIRVMATCYRDEAWYGLLDADRLARYCGALSSALLRRQRLLDGFVAFGSTGAVASMLLAAPPPAAMAFAAAVAAAALWSLLARYGEGGARAAPACDEMIRIAQRWRLLWNDIDALCDDDARSEIAALQDAMHRCTQGIHLPVRQRLNERCAAATYATMQAQYHAAAA